MKQRIFLSGSIWFSLILLQILGRQGAAMSGNEADSLESRIDAIFKEWNCPQTPGGAIAVVKEGKLIFLKGYGCADLENSVGMTPSTRLYMGSISKQFVGYCVARLILDGKLALDDDVRKHIPEMSSFPNPIRVRDLVYQKSGLRDLYGLLPLTGFRLNGHVTNEDVLKILCKQKELNFPTGEEWEYSNSNYFLLAEMIKRITGMSAKEWAKRVIFDPLEMNHTFFVDSIETLIPSRANSYHQNADKTFSGDPFLDVTIGHTGLYSTAEDMAKWLMHFRDMMQRGDPLWALMLQNDILNNGRAMENYSFGLYKTAQKAPNYWHRGSLFGYKSIISYYPQQDFGLVILGNVQTFNRSRYAREVTRLFFPEIVPADPVSSATPIVAESLMKKKFSITPGALKRYEGNFFVAPTTVYMVRAQEKSLTLQDVSGSRTIRLVPLARNQFRNDEGSLLISFSEGDGGIVDKMIYQSAAEKISGEKTKTLPAAEENEFTGDYGNDELEISIRIVETPNGLEAANLALGRIALFPTLPDQFRCDHDFFSYITFFRNGDKSISGFLLEGFGVRKMRFAKR